MLVNVDGQGLRSRTQASGIIGQGDVVLAARPRGGSSGDAGSARTVEAKTIKRPCGRKREAGCKVPTRLIVPTLAEGWNTLWDPTVNAAVAPLTARGESR